MGESQLTLFRPDFNRSLRVEARPERLTADAGALLLRELLDRSGVSRVLAEGLVEERVPERITHPLSELVRTWLLLGAQGYPDQLDAPRLKDDPAFRVAVSERRGQRPLRPARGREPEGLASQPTLSRTLEMLSIPENLEGLSRALLESGQRLAPWEARRGRERTLDLDSLPIEVFGHQPGSAYNGHFRCRCYHPLIVRSAEGFFLAARLREGNCHTADGALAFALPVVRRALTRAEGVWLRIDAGFPEDRFLGAIEGEPRARYVARLRSNAVLERLIAPYLHRPPGRPPGEGRIWLHELRYGARTWEKERRVVGVVLERPEERDGQLRLFLDHFFLLTNATLEEASAEEILTRYRQRGTAEKDLGEWKQALHVRLSSTPRSKEHYRGRPLPAPFEEPDSFAANEARLLLAFLSANLLQAASRLATHRQGESWSRERFRQLVLKAAARVLLTGRHILIVLDRARAALWHAFWQELERAYPIRGSPAALTLPPA